MWMMDAATLYHTVVRRLLLGTADRSLCGASNKETLKGGIEAVGSFQH